MTVRIYKFSEVLLSSYNRIDCGFNLFSLYIIYVQLLCEQYVDIGDTCSTEALPYNDNGLCNNAQNKEKSTVALCNNLLITITNVNVFVHKYVCTSSDLLYFVYKAIAKGLAKIQ